MVALALVFALGRLGRTGQNPVRLILARAAISAMTGLISCGLLQRYQQTLQAFRFRLWAGCPGALLAFGDNMATALGILVARVKGSALLLAALLAAVDTLVAGSIPFVGLVAWRGG